MFTAVKKLKKGLSKVAVKSAIVQFIDRLIEEDLKEVKKCKEFRKLSEMLGLEEIKK